MTTHADAMRPMRDVRLLARFIWRVDGRKFAAALCMMLLASLTEGVSIVLLAPMLRVLNSHERQFSLHIPELLQRIFGTTVRVDLAALLAGFAFFVSLRAVLTRAKDIYLADLLYKFINTLRSGVFTAVTRARWEFLLRSRISHLNHALTADIDRVQTATMQLMLLAQSSVLLAAYLLVSVVISPPLTLLAMVVGGGAVLVLAPIRRRAARYGANLTSVRQEQYRVVDEFLGGLKVAKSLNAEHRYVVRLAQVLTRMREDYVNFLRLNSTGTTLFQIVSASGLALFIYVAITVFALPVASLVVLILLFMRIAPRIVGLQANLQDVLVNLHAFTAMLKIRQQCHVEREQQAGNGTGVPSAALAIAFEHVQFGYAAAEGRLVLEDLSFAIPAGSITTIVGPSGSGKSTIADMLLRLLEPTKGRLAINGVALDSIDRGAWRDRIAYVQQDTYLVHASLAENFHLSASDATEEEIWQALTAANAAGFVRALPAQLETIVGERGVRLSGGERQRIALARAMIRRPSLLVLDEATSSLDWDSRNLVIRSIEALRGQMTIVAIDHGYGMAAIADHVVVLEKGRVVESGLCSQLLASGSGYLNAMRSSEQRGPDLPATDELISAIDIG